MALVAKLNDVKVSDPDGQEVALFVSYIEDTISDPKLQIMASHTFLFGPFPNTAPNRAAIRDSIINYGQQVKAALASRDAFLVQFPAGSSIAIP